MAQMIKSLPAIQKTQAQSLGQEDPLEKEMATQSSILAREISWTEEPSELQLMGSLKVGQDVVTERYSIACMYHICQWTFRLLPFLVTETMARERDQ